jgi:hypothetical protein
MNAKKAKALRALTKHLQNKGVIENQEWEVASTIDHRKVFTPSNAIVGDGKSTENFPQVVIHKQRVLDPACGKAIYKTMKARAELNGRG